MNAPLTRQDRLEGGETSNLRENPSIPGWFCWAVLIVIAALFLGRNLPWHLDDYDQAKQAFTSFEMVKEGHWWFQHTPTGRIATKPPLAGWISAGIYLLTGSWQSAWRIPSWICGLALLVLLWRKGNTLLGRNYGGFLAMAAFGFTVFTPRIATLVRTDMMLCACIFVCGYLVLDKVQTQSAWTHNERWTLFGFLLASMMIKGPIAYAFLLPGLVAYAFFAHRFQFPNHSWSGSWSWFAPLSFFALWAIIGICLSPEFYDQVVLKEFLGRFSTGENAVHQPRNPVFYIGLIALRWQPWSLILIAYACLKPVRAAFRRDPAMLWLACWSLGGLFIMSVVPSKRFDRILPVIPPLCLLLVAMVRHVSQLPKPTVPLRLLTLASVTLSFLISASYAGHAIFRDYQTHQGALVDFGKTVSHLTKERPDHLAVISGKDEGLLLYTGKTEFTRLKDALTAWRAGTLHWLVIPEKILVENRELLTPFQELAKTGKVPEKSNAYVLISRP